MKKNLLFVIVIFCFSSTFSQNFKWAKQFKSDNFYPKNFKTDALGNIMVAGTFENTIDFDMNSGVSALTSTQSDIFMAKYDSLGNLLWAKRMGGTNVEFVYDFTFDKYGNILLAGMVQGVVDINPGAGITNIGTNGIATTFIAKFNHAGTFTWVKTFGEPMHITKIAADMQGRVLVCGSLFGKVDFNPSSAVYNLEPKGYGDIFIARYNFTGTFSWAKRLGDTLTYSSVNDIYVDTLNNAFICGSFMGTMDFDPSSGQQLLTSPTLNVFFAKYTSSGSFSFVKKLNGTAGYYAQNITTDKKGDITLSGRFSGTIDVNPSTAVNNLTSFSPSTMDIYVAKYNSTGNYKWAFRLGNTKDDFYTNHQVDKKGNIYIYGLFKGTVDFNPSSAVYNLTSASSTKWDLFLLQVDSSGSFKNVFKLGNTSDKNADLVAIDNYGNTYIMGLFIKPIDFDPSTNTYNLTSNTRDRFIAKYYYANSNAPGKMEDIVENRILEKDSSDISFSVFPNPTNNILNVKIENSNQMISNNQIKIYDFIGRDVSNMCAIEGSGNNFQINSSKLSNGTYLLLVSDRMKSTFIKQ